MATDKRKAPIDDPAYLSTANQLVKRQKSVPRDNGSALTVSGAGSSNGALIKSMPRTSSLKAPIMELAVLWNTFGECENYGIMTGHRGAVLDLQWSRDSRNIYSASADLLVANWDVETGTRIRRHIGHENFVNTLDVTRRGPELIFSGSDDGSIGIWDPRSKDAVDYLETNFPITALAVSEAGNELYTGGIENDITVWDLRKRSASSLLRGHNDTITSLGVSPDGQQLLSNSMDNSVRTWDIRPLAASDRLLKIYEGAPSGLDKNLIRASWSPKGDKIATGSGDRSVVVWDVDSKKILYKLPGHKGTVNDVRFMPGSEPIIVSASSDKNLMLGELGK